MPSFNIVKETEIKKTFRTQSIIGQFDLQIKDKVKEQFIGNIDIENKDWQIGVIVGSSGSGKTTIAKSLYENYYINNYEYDNNSVIDNMPKDKDTQTIMSVFNSVGFATIWSWLKPYNVLSNGEKMRVDLARAILTNSDIIVFDEFTSVVDRTVAKSSSYAISKAIKKTNKKFIAVACHKDILEWLEPDWIYDTDKQCFFLSKMNSKDLKCKLRLGNVQQKYGIFLESITI